MDIKDLKETAALAHLNLSEEELLAAFPAFEEMLGFFAVMHAADSDPPVFSGTGTVSSPHFRSDSVAEDSLSVLERAGETDGSFIVIPNVL
ncbi:MAG: aspartyl/glutamyl-tRNA amidotransferase subunit C [Treponema sp.]|jgi:aspartyl-tRNA(Asn)/glutamyl-tRNA(Gln) amidotransferase subunit C|nr:aspartyl/glutamyl-tRNA amidotransferase subunit C [Treponema sp.]